MHRRRGREPLRHRQHKYAAIGLCQQAALGDRAAGKQGGIEVETSEQAAVGNMQRQMFQRTSRRQRGTQHLKPAIPYRAGARSDKYPAGARWIDGEQLRRRDGIGPGGGASSQHFRDGAVDPHRGAGIVERVATQAMA